MQNELRFKICIVCWIYGIEMRFERMALEHFRAQNQNTINLGIQSAQNSIFIDIFVVVPHAYLYFVCGWLFGFSKWAEELFFFSLLFSSLGRHDHDLLFYFYYYFV